MKKIISLILLVVVVLALSGCEDGYLSDNHKECVENGGTYSIPELVCYENIESYSQEEVNDLLDQQASEIMEVIYDNYIEYDEFNKILYSNCLIVDGIKYCEIVINLNEDYVTAEEYQELLNIIESLEIQDIETNITYSVLAMLDILIYMYDEEVESGTIFSEEEIVYYDMLEMMRTEYLNVLEGE